MLVTLRGKRVNYIITDKFEEQSIFVPFASKMTDLLNSRTVTQNIKTRIL